MFVNVSRGPSVSYPASTATRCVTSASMTAAATSNPTATASAMDTEMNRGLSPTARQRSNHAKVAAQNLEAMSSDVPRGIVRLPVLSHFELNVPHAGRMPADADGERDERGVVGNE